MIRIRNGLYAAAMAVAICAGMAVSAPAETSTRGCFKFYKDAGRMLERCGKAIHKAQRKGRNVRLAKSLLHRAMIHHDLQDYDAGLRDVQAALALAADLGPEQRRRVEIAAHMAGAFLHDRRNDEAAFAASVDRLIAADSSGMGEAFALATLLRALRERGLHGKAVSLAGAALADGPPDNLSMSGFSRGVMTRLDLLHARGTLLARMNKLPEAEADFTTILQHGDGPAVRLARAQARHRMGNTDGALADLDAARKDKAFDPGTVNMIRQLLRIDRGGKGKAATFSGDPRDHSRYSTAHPTDRAIALYVDVWMLRCELLLDKGLTAQAADDCTRAEEYFPDDIVRFDVLERLARAQGRMDDAALYAEKAEAQHAEEQADSPEKRAAAEKPPAADPQRMTVSAQTRTVLAALDSL